MVAQTMWYRLQKPYLTKAFTFLAFLCYYTNAKKRRGLYNKEEIMKKILLVLLLAISATFVTVNLTSADDAGTADMIVHFQKMGWEL